MHAVTKSEGSTRFRQISRLAWRFKQYFKQFGACFRSFLALLARSNYFSKTAELRKLSSTERMVMDLDNFDKLCQSQQPLRNFVRFVTFAKLMNFLGPFNQVNAIHSYNFANSLAKISSKSLLSRGGFLVSVGSLGYCCNVSSIS